MCSVAAPLAARSIRSTSSRCWQPERGLLDDVGTGGWRPSRNGRLQPQDRRHSAVAVEPCWSTKPTTAATASTKASRRPSRWGIGETRRVQVGRSTTRDNGTASNYGGVPGWSPGPERGLQAGRSLRRRERDTTAGGYNLRTATRADHTHRFRQRAGARCCAAPATTATSAPADPLAAAMQPGGLAVSPATIGPGTVLTVARATRSRTWTRLPAERLQPSRLDARHEARRDGTRLRSTTSTPLPPSAAGRTILPNRPSAHPNDGGQSSTRALREVRRTRQRRRPRAMAPAHRTDENRADVEAARRPALPSSAAPTAPATANAGGTNTTPPGTQTAERERTDCAAVRVPFQPNEQPVATTSWRHLVQHLRRRLPFSPNEHAAGGEPQRRAGRSVSTGRRAADRRASRFSTPPS